MRKIIAMGIVAGVAAATTAAHANPYNDIMIVAPAELPELARQGGDSMLLRRTKYGQEFLYIEQDNGSKLAAFDVTNPVRVEAEGVVQLETSGAFDFVAPVGEHAELIRFRQNQAEAVLSFNKDKAPSLETVEAIIQPNSASVVDEPGPRETDIRKEVSNVDTGTMFVLTKSGLYLIRRPAVELDRKRRAQQWFENHVG